MSAYSVSFERLSPMNITLSIGIISAVRPNKSTSDLSYLIVHSVSILDATATVLTSQSLDTYLVR